MNLVANIKSLCQIKGITISRLEKTLDMSYSSISKWENGNPSLKKVMEIAQYFNVSIEFLCNSDLGETHEITKIFVENLITKTEHKNLIWEIVRDEHDKDRYAIERDDCLLADYDPDAPEQCLDNDVIIYRTKSDEASIFCITQHVSPDFEPGSYIAKYFYLAIKKDDYVDFLQANKDQIKSLYEKIDYMTYKLPREEKVKEYMLDFIRS